MRQTLSKLFSSLMVAALSLQPAAVALADTAPSDSTNQTQSTDPQPSSTSTDSQSTTPAPSDQSTTPQSTDSGSSSAQPTSSSQSAPPASAASSSPSPAPAPKPLPNKPSWAFNDATGKWVAINQASLTWDPGLYRWVSPYYSFDPSVGWYHVIQNPVISSAGGGTGAANPLAALLGLNDPANSNTGPDSTNNSSLTNNNTALLNFLTNALITNNDNSSAISGDAVNSGNTIGGGASTGDANVVANLVNLLNSVWSWAGGNLSYLFQNFFGDHTGDIMINPSAMAGGGGQIGGQGTLNTNSNTGPGSTNNATTTNNGELTVNNTFNGAINNNLDLLAASGDATVSGNTVGGDARSGNANVELSILNMINSAIAAGNSFFGLLNIFGNLNGDILFPNGFLNSVVGAGGPGSPGTTTVGNSNTGPDSTNNASATNNNSLNVTNNVNGTFNNNINLGAASGDATVTGNTQAGGATTGNADTSNNLYNLFNTSLFGDNAVLVLVNVMGHWVGHIMNLPDGGSSTGALLGGNAMATNDTTGPNSTNNATSTSNNNASITNNVNGTINNNITAGALSGDATVSGNTIGGSATSGNAKVASNVANLFGSHLNLTKWFGVLVINVFGDWTGSVGDDTAAGNTVSAQTQTTASGGGQTIVHTLSSNNVQTSGLNGGTSGGSTSNSNNTSVHVLAASSPGAVAAAKTAAKDMTLLFEIAAGVMLIAAALGALDRRLLRTR